MADLMQYEPGTMIDLKTLPADLQKRIRQYAAIDILKDEAKADIKANQ